LTPQVKEDKASLNEMERRLKEVEAERSQLAAAAAEAAAAGLHLEKEKREKAEQVGVPATCMNSTSHLNLLCCKVPVMAGHVWLFISNVGLLGAGA
jgi:hypothetical protein